MNFYILHSSGSNRPETPRMGKVKEHMQFWWKHWQVEPAYNTDVWESFHHIASPGTFFVSCRQSALLFLLMLFVFVLTQWVKYIFADYCVCLHKPVMVLRTECRMRRHNGAVSLRFVGSHMLKILESLWCESSRNFKLIRAFSGSLHT